MAKGIPQSKTKVAILMGSDSDLNIMKEAGNALQKLNILYEMSILSAHRCPQDLIKYVQNAPKRGIRIFIAGAGGAAHLAGVVAAFTEYPVIGVPIPFGPLQGHDALLAMVQMPKGVPVATVAIGNAWNAGLLAVQILGTGETFESKQIVQRFLQYKAELREEVLTKNKKINK